MVTDFLTFMHNASDAQSQLYSNSCPHNDIKLLCIFGELLPQTDSVSSDNLSYSPVQATSFNHSRRDGGLFLRITDVGCLQSSSLHNYCFMRLRNWSQAKRTTEAESVKMSGVLVSVPTSVSNHSLSLMSGIESIPWCLCFFRTQTLPLSNFFLFLSPSTPHSLQPNSNHLLTRMSSLGPVSSYSRAFSHITLSSIAGRVTLESNQGREVLKIPQLG